MSTIEVRAALRADAGARVYVNAMRAWHNDPEAGSDAVVVEDFEDYARIATEAGFQLTPAGPEGLQEAWSAAEAALPKHWRFAVVPYCPEGWEAEAHNLRHPSTGRGRHGSGAFYGDTPAAALSALAAALGDLP